MIGQSHGEQFLALHLPLLLGVCHVSPDAGLPWNYGSLWLSPCGGSRSFGPRAVNLPFPISWPHGLNEGHYHWLLQLIITVGMACVLLEIASPHNVLILIMRSTSLLFLGFSFIQMGFVVFTITFVPKGCTFEDYMAICEDEVAKTRAKALANLQFSW